MPVFHRLVPPTYLGGVPATHDEINNATSGIPALADVVKGTGPNAGSYFIAFGEDGTSSDGNRAHAALASNTDYLDDVANSEVPIVTNVDGVAPGGGLASLALTGDVFVGKSGTANNQDERDRLIKVVDSVTGNDVIDASGVTVKASLIHDGSSTNQVGVPASGFYTAPTVNFTPNIPASTSYRIFYARRSSFRDISRDKVGLDAFTRQVIRGAHQVPGEGIRFIREAGRRALGSGGPVTALAATIIETPGLGENILSKSNTMNVDIDPDGTQGTNGSFEVRFDRDGSSKTLFSVEEGASAGLSSWQSISERIALGDINTLASGFGQTILPFSSGTATEGDNHLRISEVDFASTPVSLIKRLNAVWAVTVGDGVNSFGDFNGITAIADAFSHYNAAGLNIGIRIFVKRGLYEVDDEKLTLGSSIVIEGTHRDQVTVRNANGASLPAFSHSSVDTYIELRNITFTKSSGGSDLGIDTAGALLIENCNFIDQQIRLNRIGDPTGKVPVLLARNSIFNFSSSSTGVQPIDIYGGGTTHESHGFIFEDCEISAWQDAALLRVIDQGATNHALSGIVFRRCTLRCAGTATLGGNLTAIVGVLELSPNGGNGTAIDDITWEDCDVTANWGAVGDNQILMYMRTHDGLNSIAVDKVRISGGEWDAGGVDSDISPFYMGGQTLAAARGPNRVEIENVRWGFSTAGLSNGVPTTEIAAGSAASWAAFYIGCYDLKMHNVTWLTNVGLSDSGDLFINLVRKLDILGLYLGSGNWTAGVGTAPEYRVKIITDHFIQFGMVAIRDVMISNSVSINATVGSLVLGRVAGAAQSMPSLVENCNLNGNIEVGGALIYVAGGAAGSEEGNGWHFENCRLETCAGNGFLFDWSTAGREPLRDIRIANTTVVDCDDVGIHFNFGTAETLSDVDISGCHIKDCTGYGLHVEGTAPWDVNASGLTLRNNHFDGNSGSRSGTQIFIDAMSGSVGCLYGNTSAAVATVPGLIASASGASDDLRGTEVAYTYDPTAGAVAAIDHTVTALTTTPDKRLHKSGGSWQMLHNRFRLSVP